MVASVWTSSAVNVCTAERLERNAEGKADGFDVVVTVVGGASGRGPDQLRYGWEERSLGIPTFTARSAHIAYQSPLLGRG